ncbi:minor capsid protein [Streptomyces sp. BPTC-684]|uniref:minor capsid protein n=1 Tax=Streptomyces sp. BPTC-684 TaxID=3043734 RepID=UPI0024B04763|nr:minor capsid protein [Streptomyces sp. BPTC-684]WHM36314.1 minor capsid protein [Streptomyces sp. BPTC-684]
MLIYRSVMPDLLDGLARHLSEQKLLSYDPTGTNGDCFIESMPPTPDAAVGLWLYDGGAQDSLNAYDRRRLQVRVRGGSDPRASRRRCEAIYSELHGLAGIQLPADGPWLILAAARGTPAPMGPDSSGRHEHVVNFDLDVSAPTTHRTE